jgi:Concanavalin A-like lectin/glucanases superfamily
MDADLSDLLAAWLGGGDPGGERRAALLARLRGDEAFRRAFVDEVHLLGRIKAAQAPEPRWLRLEDELGWSARERTGADAFEGRVVRAARDWSRRRRLLRRTLTTAAAILVGVGLAAFFLRPRATPEVAVAPAPAPFATATQLDAVLWDPEADLRPKLGTILGAGRLRLLGGRVTLTFVSGVTLTVEAPADLDLQAVDRVFCRQGRLRTRVPAGAEGFTVQSAGYEVVDLGTEFGLNADADGTANVMVFQGKASVSLLGADGRTTQSALVEGQQSVRVDAAAATIRDVDPRPDLYPVAPEEADAALDLDPSYPAEVARSKPWGYWRFGAVADGKVSNAVPGRPALVIEGGVEVGGRPGGNGTALFRPGDSEQGLLMDGEWAPPRAGGYALELWVRGEGQGPSALVSLIDAREGAAEKHVGLLELTARSRWSAQEPCALRFLDRWPPAVAGGVNVFSRRNYLAGVWHHVVGQNNGGDAQLFIDGALVGMSGAAEDGSTTPCRLLVGRLKLEPADRNDARPFEGRLGELAVYDRPLTPEEIRRHAQARRR